MKRTYLAVLLTTCMGVSAMAVAGDYGSAGHGAAHWGYEGDFGPAHWGEMKEEFVSLIGHNSRPVQGLNARMVLSPE